jgi:hypothetical protein
VSEQEGTEQERSLFSFKSVVRPVAVNESTFVSQQLLGRVNGREDAGVVSRQEANERHHQVGGVEIVRAEGLSEGLGCFTPSTSDYGL